jgi:threonylcarbamoyladenosine tRNA methylthiotransferase MtaB
MKYSIITFGCRVNQADSLGFEEGLRLRGATAAVSPDDADVVIVNTCSVTAAADQAARQTVRRLARLNPEAKVVVTGCYATRDPDEFRGLANVLRVVPNGDKASVVPLLAADLGLTTSERFGDGDGSCGAAIEPGIAGRTAFTLRVQTGCAQPCAYCIIPATRGAPRSVPVEEILAGAERVTAAGFREIALSGVHLGSYGRDLQPAASLIELLRSLARRHGLKAAPDTEACRGPSSDHPDNSGRDTDACRGRSVDRPDTDACRGRSVDRPNPDVRFRISSLEPMDCSHEVVDLVAEHDCFAPHFHLPLQHASDRMLTAMRRPYDRAFYAALVGSIRSRIPSASIGSDVIVGFPGETDEDFEQLCQYLEHSPLTHVHVFPYSDRPGTAATSMGAKVHGAVTRDRAARAREIGRRLTVRFRQTQLGTVHRALTLEDGSLAVTGNYLKVRIAAGHARNEWIGVRITDAGESMRGEAVD